MSSSITATPANGFPSHFPVAVERDRTGSRLKRVRKRSPATGTLTAEYGLNRESPTAVSAVSTNGRSSEGYENDRGNGRKRPGRRSRVDGRTERTRDTRFAFPMRFTSRFVFVDAATAIDRSKTRIAPSKFKTQWRCRLEVFAREKFVSNVNGSRTDFALRPFAFGWTDNETPAHLYVFVYFFPVRSITKRFVRNTPDISHTCPRIINLFVRDNVLQDIFVYDLI